MMTKHDKRALQDVIDELDSLRAKIQTIQENEDPADGNIDYLESAVDQITEAIGNIEWVV